MIRTIKVVKDFYIKP